MNSVKFPSGTTQIFNFHFDNISIPNGTTIKAYIARHGSDTNIAIIQGANITLRGNVVTVKLNPSITQDLSGAYDLQCSVESADVAKSDRLLMNIERSIS